MKRSSCTINSLAGVATAAALAHACSFDRTPLRRSQWDGGAQAVAMEADAAQRAADAAMMVSPAISRSGGAARAGAGATGTTGTATDEDAGRPDPTTDPAPHGWLKQLTLDGSQVDASLTNFPLLIQLSDAQLKAAARSDGSDIHFLADDAMTLLDYEIERYDSDNGALVAWVRMPQLAPNADTRLYLAYADGQGDRSNPAGLWSDYEYVWHLSEDPGEGSFKDSAKHADGTAQGDMTSADRIDGIAGAGIELDGTDDRIAFRNVYSGPGPTTISAWVDMIEDTGDNGAIVIAFGREAQGQARFLMSQDATNGNATGAGFYTDDVSGPTLPQARWSHLVWSWNGVQSSIYIDGTLAAGPTVHLGANTEGADGAIGASIFSYPRSLKGRLDEVRVATSARAGAFIHLEYASQKPDSTFIKSVAPQVPKP